MYTEKLLAECMICDERHRTFLPVHGSAAHTLATAICDFPNIFPRHALAEISAIERNCITSEPKCIANVWDGHVL